MGHALGEFGQDLVAGGVPVGVVDLLEGVDVDHRQRQRLAAGQRPLHQAREMSHQVVAIVEAGQLVGQRH